MTNEEIKDAYEHFLFDFKVEDQIDAIFDWISSSKEKDVSNQMGLLLLVLDHHLDPVLPFKGRVIRSDMSADLGELISHSLRLITDDYCRGTGCYKSSRLGIAFTIAFAHFTDPGSGKVEPIVQLMARRIGDTPERTHIFSISRGGVSAMFS